MATIVLLSALAAFGITGRELPWAGHDQDADQTFIRHMSTHHAQGIELARQGVERAHDPHLRKLAALMVAIQTGENQILDVWWNSWFGTTMPDCTADERANMPGFLTPAQMQAVKSASADRFDALFVDMMSLHHKGAVKMADETWHGRGDPRLRITAHAIRHGQQGEIALMRGTSGLAAVTTAFHNMFADNVNRPSP